MIPKGKVVHELGSHLDLLPTIAKAAGVAPPADRTLDGGDALPLAVTGATLGARCHLLVDRRPACGAARKMEAGKGGKLYDGSPEGGKALTGEDALFLSNLEEDPAESVNLRRQFPGMVDELATLIQKWSDDVKNW